MRKAVEEEINRIIPIIPKVPPEHTIETLKKRGMLIVERLLYGIEYEKDPISGKRTKKVRVKCSACGGEALLEWVGNDSGCHYGGSTYGFVDPFDRSNVCSGMSCICPVCGKGLTALHKASFKSNTIIDSRICMSLHEVEGHLAVLSWVIEKRLYQDGSVTYTTRPYEGIVVIEKTLVRVKGYNKFMSSYSWLSDWTYTQRCDDEIGYFDKKEVVEALSKTVERTECRNSAIVEYLRSSGKLSPWRYLKLWLKHPNVENLVRQGFLAYLSDLMGESAGYYGTYYRESFKIEETDKYINWSESKPSAMLGLPKDELDVARFSSLKGTEFYKKVKQTQGVRLDKKYLDIAKKFGYSSVDELIDKPIHGYKVRIIRVLNYLQNQQESSRRKDLISCGYLRDYWRSLYDVYKSLPQELIYPKDLERSHDEMLLRVKEKENAKINAQIAKRLPSLEFMEYEDESLGLFIRVAASHSELIKEGKLLHHCVGGYASSHAEGKTTILFIRHIDSPSIPFFTLEYKNGKVMQNRGDHNCARTPEVEAFECKWLEHIKNKEFMSNGKRNNENREPVRAGA